MVPFVVVHTASCSPTVPVNGFHSYFHNLFHSLKNRKYAHRAGTKISLLVTSQTVAVLSREIRNLYKYNNIKD